MQTLHSISGWFVIFANAAAGIWALLAHRHLRLRKKLGWYFVALAQAAIALVAISGVFLPAEEVDGQHQLYGFAAFASVGIIYAYRGEVKSRPYLVYGLGSLWLMGLAIRALYLT